MQSRWLGHSVLLTFGGGNIPRAVGGGGAVRSDFNDDGDSFQSSSSSKVRSDGSGASEGSSSKRWISSRSFGVTTRWRQLGWQWRLGFRSNSLEIRHYLYGFLYWIVGGKNSNNFLVHILLTQSTTFEIRERGIELGYEMNPIQVWTPAVG
jgi:hypothetical protein